MNKLIFVQYQPLTRKGEADFFFTELIKHGFTIEFWDLSILFFGNIELCDSIKNNTIRKIYSNKELESLIIGCDIESTLFIPQITYEWRVIKLFRLFTKHKCKTAYFARGALPTPNLSLKVQNLFKLNYVQLLNKAISVIKGTIARSLKKIGYIKSFDYIFNSGIDGIVTIGNGYTYDQKKSQIIQINSFDYDDYLLSIEHDSKLISENYCIFLDDYLPYHPDFKILNIQSTNPDTYYSKLNAFFDSVESNLQIKVVIAAHPKSDYRENPFNGRPIYKYKTNELAKYSKFVMAHMSSSINFGILYKRPILFIITNDFKTPKLNYIYSLTTYFSEVLNSKLINCDKIQEHMFYVDEIKIDTQKYLNYKYRYLTSAESELMFSKDIVVNFIKKL